MGIMRSLYRELRETLGLKAPAENATQLAERICGELKSEIGGKKQQQDQDWMLESKFEGRDVKILFDAAGLTAVIEVGSSLEGGPLFVLVSEQSAREKPRGTERKPVASGVFAEGRPNDVSLMMDLWKALPTGARGNLTSLVGKYKGTVRYEDGAVRIEPETSLLEGPSAKYNVKSLLQTMTNLTGEMEKAWSNL